jgi:hypothetical protein
MFGDYGICISCIIWELYNWDRNRLKNYLKIGHEMRR